MNLNALDWNKKTNHTPGFEELRGILTPAAIDGHPDEVARALELIAAIDLSKFTVGEQSALRGLIGDVRASRSRLLYTTDTARLKKTQRPQRHRRPRIGF